VHVTPIDYAFLRQCIKARCGLVLSPNKQDLVESRLAPVARKAGFNYPGELVVALKNARGCAPLTAAVEALFAGDTYFSATRQPSIMSDSRSCRRSLPHAGNRAPFASGAL
jgi:chemotaxis protein methyltransferase CheR